MTLAYYKILTTNDDFVRDLLAVQQRLLPDILKEQTAAAQIQKCWKRYKANKLIDDWHIAAAKIQKTWKIWLQRRKASEQRVVEQKQVLKQFIDSAAAKIQATWRGYRTRKCILDFYKRKRKLKEVQLVNEEMQDKIRANFRRQVHEEALRLKEEVRQEVDKKLERSHCLLSTKQVPGVYSKNKILESAIKEQTRRALHQGSKYL